MCRTGAGAGSTTLCRGKFDCKTLWTGQFYTREYPEDHVRGNHELREDHAGPLRLTKKNKKSDITPDPGGHRRTGADMCRTGVDAGSSAGADKGPDRRQSNHERTDDQAGRRRPANTDSNGDSPVHAAADTPSKNAATSDTHCKFMRQGGGRPRAAAGSRRNGTRQAVAATTGVRSEGNAATNTADAQTQNMP